jgi:hypothetical protein
MKNYHTQSVRRRYNLLLAVLVIMMTVVSSAAPSTEYRKTFKKANQEEVVYEEDTPEYLKYPSNEQELLTPDSEEVHLKSV